MSDDTKVEGGEETTGDEGAEETSKEGEGEGEGEGGEETKE